MNEKELIEKYRIESCMRCNNECSSVCPVFAYYGKFEPKDLARLFVEEGKKAVEGHKLLRTCVTCRTCTDVCPFGVVFADFIRDLRVGLGGFHPVFGGLLHEYQRMQARGPTPLATRERAIRFDSSTRIDPSSDIVLFTGCLALFDSLTGGDRFSSMAKAAVKLLNKAAIAPAIIEDERCCGRDLYDIGERDSFLSLARHNYGEITKRRAKMVLTVCPECAYTIGETYRSVIGESSFEVMHIAQYLSERIGKLDIEPEGSGFALHDACYLSRYMGVKEAPRKLLSASCEGKLIELKGKEKKANCCGAGSLVDHGPHTRKALESLFVEAHKAGASTLVTTCPRCILLHEELRVDSSWRCSSVGLEDLLTLSAGRLRK